MVHGRIGAGGEEEMLLARQDPRLGALAPLNSYARVRVAMPDSPARIGTFGAYADATMDQVLGATQGASHADRDRDAGPHGLPQSRRPVRGATAARPEAQLAPAFYAGVADFDGDGAEDVFLSQNFYSDGRWYAAVRRRSRVCCCTGDGKGA